MRTVFSEVKAILSPSYIFSKVENPLKNSDFIDLALFFRGFSTLLKMYEGGYSFYSENTVRITNITIRLGVYQDLCRNFVFTDTRLS